MRGLPPADRGHSPIRACHMPGAITGVRRTHLVAGMAALVVMLLLKQHYSTATADDLRWILAPTARLVSWITPLHPVFESGVGYVDFTRGIIIAPACAGVNFMIMVFGLTVWNGIRREDTASGHLILLATALAAAYGVAVAVNTLRIALSMALYHVPVHGGWLTADRIHRMAGIMIYFGALWLYYQLAARIIGRTRMQTGAPAGRRIHRRSPGSPYGWYTVIAVGVPMISGNLANHSPKLCEHAATIIAAMICFRFVELLFQRPARR